MLVAAASTPAIGQANFEMQIELCRLGTDTSPQKIVEACTEVIDAGFVDVRGYHYVRAKSFERLGDLKNARRDFALAIQIDALNADAWRGFGKASEALGRPNGLIESLNEAARIAKGNYAGLRDVCLARGVSGVQLDAALDNCDASIALKNDQADTYAARGYVRYRLGDFGNAVGDCNAALKLDRSLAAALYVRGLAETRMGYADIGAKDMRDAVAIWAHIADEYPPTP